MQTICAVRDISGHAREEAPPAVRFHELLPAGRSCVRPPLFLLGATNPLVTKALFGQTDTPQIGCYMLQDAIVAPTGIAVKDGTAFCSAAFIHPPHHVVAIVDRLNATPLPVRHIAGKLAVIYGPAHETHGHWLTDFMPRLSVLHDAGHDIATLRFVVPPDLRPEAAALLRGCGITDAQLVRYAYWQEVLRTDLLLMPTGPRLGDRMSPYFARATSFWTDRLRAPAPPTTPGARLFLSRAAAPQQRRMGNRPAIEAIAERAGFTLVQPEKLSMPAQMALFETATMIVGEYGSALHNSIFAEPGTIICALRGNSRHPGFIQSGIGTVLGQETGYVFGNTAGQEVDQRFDIDPAAFSRALELMMLHRP